MLWRVGGGFDEVMSLEMMGGRFIILVAVVVWMRGDTGLRLNMF
jgi:hypothetical protein